MAIFSTTCVDDAIAQLAELARLPENAADDILAAMASVVEKAQQSKIRSLGLVSTGRLADSIAAELKNGAHGHYALVYPRGTHHTYKSRKTGKYSAASNAEVGFVHEYGAPQRNISAKHWMRTANEESAEARVSAGQTALDKFIDSNL